MQSTRARLVAACWDLIDAAMTAENFDPDLIIKEIEVLTVRVEGGNYESPVSHDGLFEKILSAMLTHAIYCAHTTRDAYWRGMSERISAAKVFGDNYGK